MNSPKAGQASVVLLLVFMALLAGGAARRESATVDEVAHLAAGVSYLQKLDLRMNEEHPPLAKILAALPVVVRGAHADYSGIPWTFSGTSFNQLLGEWVFGDYFLFRWNDPVSTLRWARIPMLLITLLLGFILYRCGSRLGGSALGGLLCLTAFVSMPAFLAFGPLVITDVVVTLFWILVVWQLPAMWHSPTRSQVINFGLVLGGAFLSKFSSGLLFLVFPAVALSLRLRPVPNQPSDKAELKIWRRRAWRNISKGVMWAAVFVYAVYLILSWNQPTDSFSLIPHFPNSSVLRRLLMPLWLYLGGLLEFVFSAGSRPTFILGHAYSHGVWFYFPVLFLLKSPMAFLLLLALAIIAAVMVKWRGAAEFHAIPGGMELHWRCVWVSMVVFTAACMLNRLDISIRHFLIPVALMILMLAPLPRMLRSLHLVNRRAARLMTAASIILVCATLVTAVAAYRKFFPFINSLGMGKPAYLLVNDSNLDWNQALPEVERFVTQRGIQRVLLDAYTFSEPQAYIPQAQIWDCQKPTAADNGQWAVVSANLIADGSNCGWLFRYLHLEIGGGSMWAFRLPDIIPPAGTVGGPPLPRDYRFLGGAALEGDLRTTFYGCIRDPQQLQPTMDRMVAAMKNYRENKHQ